MLSAETDYVDRLALFDIDNTLIRGTNVHNDAFSHSFRNVYGVDVKIDLTGYYGLTDKKIVIELLKENGLKESVIRSKLPECFNSMGKYFVSNVDEYEFFVMGGVTGLLEELSKNNILTGVVTGNIESIARGKLRKVELDHHLKVCSFGNESEKRSELVKIAIKRAEENHNFKSNDNVYVFGDTIYDMKAGKGLAKTVGVLTGKGSKEQLEEAGADFILENLKDPKKVLEILNV